MATRLRTPTGAELLPSEQGSLERGLRRFRENVDRALRRGRRDARRHALRPHRLRRAGGRTRRRPLGTIRTEVAGDALRVSLDANMKLAGAYRLDVIVADRDGNALAWAKAAASSPSAPRSWSWTSRCPTSAAPM